MADLATEADVPLGNIYYYFKTKEEIAKAVIKELREKYQSIFLKLNEQPVEGRLLGFLKQVKEEKDLIVDAGCPIGTLCQELGKGEGTLGNQIDKVMHEVLGWFEVQFKAMGFGQKSLDLAIYMVTSLQGIYLLAHSFKKPNLLNKQLENLSVWLDNVASRNALKEAN